MKGGGSRLPRCARRLVRRFTMTIEREPDLMCLGQYCTKLTPGSLLSSIAILGKADTLDESDFLRIAGDA